LIRPIDLDTTNSVASDRVAQMEIKVNGKGIVADSVPPPVHSVSNSVGTAAVLGDRQS